MKNKIIGVLMGGLSSERDISIASGNAVSNALRSKGYNVVDIDVNRDIINTLKQNRIDVAWLALHGEFGEDGCIQGLLECLGIPYTGSGVAACAISMDKRLTKRALQHSSVCLPKDCEWDSQTAFPWPAPAVIKDPLGGSSIGVWVCKTEQELKSAIAECSKLGGRYLVEEFISGIEITVAVLEGTALPVVTIIPKGEFFDLKSKYTKGQTEYLIPSEGEIISPKSELPIECAQEAQRQALEAYQELDMQGIARADFIIPCTGIHPNITLPPDSTPRFLEINAIPGMTITSLSPMAASAVGIDYPTLVESILLSAHAKPAQFE